jgi:DNA primase large subunit
MQAVGGTRHRRDVARTKVVERHAVISMYVDPPSDELTLDEFELFALDRLMVLRKVEDLRARGFKGVDFKQRVNAALRQYMNLNSFSKTVEEEMRKDVVSHFILRLAYCRTEELRRWFLAQECALFRHRLEELPPSGMTAFIRANGLDLEAVSREEKAAKKGMLLSVPDAPLLDFERTSYFKIPFTQAVDLIGSRSVYLNGGFAYVPVQRIVTVVVQRFRMVLSRSLMDASTGFGYVTGDTRFGPLLQNMSKQYVGRDFGAAGGVGDDIKARDLEALSKTSMPLCMKQLHVGLQRDHKLKHWGRLQYGLFLKGAGLSMEEAMIFFQSEFTKVKHVINFTAPMHATDGLLKFAPNSKQIMGVDQFNKQYAYNVRHMYGKEGKRTNYTPYSCLKIIMGAPPGPGDHHGCPYRHYDENRLSSLIGQLRIDTPDKDAIMGQVKSRNYQLACQRHWEATHRGYEELSVSADGVGNHPNAWIQASMQYHKAKTGGSPDSSKKQSPGKTVVAADDTAALSMHS